MTYIDAKEVARILGLHPLTIRKLAREGKIKGFRVGGVWRFNPDDLVVAVATTDKQLYNSKRGQPTLGSGSEECLSTGAEQRGTSVSPIRAAVELGKALERAKGKRRRSTTIASRPISGGNRS